MIRKILMCTLLLISAVANAQEATYSPYSLHGIGLNKFRGTIGNISMGSITTASDPVTPSVLNPATYAELKYTNFSAGGTYSSADIKSSEAESTGSATSFDYLTISIPANKFGFGFGLLPASASGYRIDEIVEGGRQLQTGKGGVNRVFLGAGTSLYKGLKVGAEFRYNFGRIENEVTRFNDDTSISNTQRIDQSDVSGVSYALSAIYDTTIKEKYNLRYSVAYEFSSAINFDNNQKLSEVSSNLNGVVIPSLTNFEDIEIPNRSFKLPSRLTLGLALSKQSVWLLASEFYIGDNNDFQDRFQTRDNIEYIDPFGVKFGGYYQPNYQSLTSYFKRIIYRGGIRYEQTGLEFNNEEINEFGISFGLSLPLREGFSTIDLGFEIGKRGTTSAGAVEENFVNFSVGLSLVDKWFRKRKFD